MTNEQDPRSLSVATLADLIKSTLPEDGTLATRTDKLLDAAARKLLTPKVPNVFVSRGLWDALAERVAKLEERAHEPFDFSDLVRRLERLERLAHDHDDLQQPVRQS